MCEAAEQKTPAAGNRGPQRPVRCFRIGRRLFPLISMASRSRGSWLSRKCSPGIHRGARCRGVHSRRSRPRPRHTQARSVRRHSRALAEASSGQEPERCRMQRFRPNAGPWSRPHATRLQRKMLGRGVQPLVPHLGARRSSPNRHDRAIALPSDGSCHYGPRLRLRRTLHPLCTI